MVEGAGTPRFEEAVCRGEGSWRPEVGGMGRWGVGRGWEGGDYSLVVLGRLLIAAASLVADHML